MEKSASFGTFLRRFLGDRGALLGYLLFTLGLAIILIMQ
jgi:hypothetical protein